MPAHQERYLPYIPTPDDLSVLNDGMRGELHIVVIFLRLAGDQCLEVRIINFPDCRNLAHVDMVAPRATTFQSLPFEQATVAAPLLPSVT